MYWLIFPINGEKLFPGSSQKERYSASLHRFLEKNAAILKTEHMDPSRIGTHSIRKGAASYVSGGTTDSPSSASVRLRAGWSLGPVQDRYIFSEKARDQYLGRLVAGLPYGTPKFSILPPHFIVDASKYVKEAFNGLTDNLMGIGTHCLASLVYHSEWINDNLPAMHPVRKSSIFNKETLAYLKSIVHCGLPSETTTMKATGIPTTVGLMTEIQKQSEAILNFTEKLEDTNHGMVDAVLRGVQEQGIGTGITLSMIKQTFQETLAQVQQAQQPANEETNDTIMHVPATRTIYLWGGKMNIIPANFELSGTLSKAWEDYVCGREGIPPLQEVPSSEIPPSCRKAYYDYQFLMKKIQKQVKKKLWKENFTPGEAYDALKKVERHLGISRTTPKGRVRRITQISWQTAATILYKHKKK